MAMGNGGCIGEQRPWRQALGAGPMEKEKGKRRSSTGGREAGSAHLALGLVGAAHRRGLTGGDVYGSGKKNGELCSAAAGAVLWWWRRGEGEAGSGAGTLNLKALEAELARGCSHMEGIR